MDQQIKEKLGELFDKAWPFIVIAILLLGLTSYFCRGCFTQTKKVQDFAQGLGYTQTEVIEKHWAFVHLNHCSNQEKQAAFFLVKANNQKMEPVMLAVCCDLWLGGCEVRKAEE